MQTAECKVHVYTMGYAQAHSKLSNGVVVKFGAWRVPNGWYCRIRARVAKI